MPIKVYIDSRFRKETGDGASDSEFTVERPDPIQVKGKAFLDTVLVPNTFYVIREGENDRLHVRERMHPLTEFALLQRVSTMQSHSRTLCWWR